MTVEAATGRVRALIDASGVGPGTLVQARPEVGSIRVVRRWALAGVEIAMHRLYTADQVRDTDDAALSARLRADVDAMDRVLVARVVTAAIARGRELGMTWGEMLEGLPL